MKITGHISPTQSWVECHEGAEFSNGALRLTGQVSTKNNGGFIQVRTRIDPTETFKKVGIKIKVKGNGEVYYLHIRNASARLPWHYYTANFQTSEKWKEILIPLMNLKSQLLSCLEN